MAKPNNSDKAEESGYMPSTPGIGAPLVVAEGGHEGARAAWELAHMAEGRFVLGDDAADKFIDYDSALTKA